jgi:hypothetical protein
MRAFNALLVLLLAGCGSAGDFRIGEHFWFEELRLRSDGSFEYENWSDDGGTVCIAEGTWVESGGTVTTTVVQIRPDSATSCTIAQVQAWRRHSQAVSDPSGRVFRRVARASS